MLVKPYSRIRHRPGEMNKTEAAYASLLGAKKAAGEVLTYYFERWKVQLADRTWYTPDFLVITPECPEFHEVKRVWRSKKKGRAVLVDGWQEDARVKWKIAAEEHPWARFVCAVWDPATGWKFEVYGEGGGRCQTV